MTTLALLACSLVAQLPEATFDDYSQWKLAEGAAGVTGAQIEAKPGFEVEVVRTAAAGEGSWISLAFDPQGRLVVGREDKGLLRFTFDEIRKVKAVQSIEETLLEPRGLLFAHGGLYVTANNAKGVYRLKDTDGDDKFDEVKLLKKLEGGVGHGRNGMALGPDGKIYLALGNNVKVPADISPLSPYRHYGVDRLLPCVWNEFLFDSDVTPPAGWIARTDKEGEKWEIFAGGFRNPYDLAFNEDGELFTYDADMEWDVGAPWYRPTTVAHVVSGGEYGWRQGTNVWPDHFPDCLPRVCDIGLGSPTGVAFGTQSNFPPQYRKALFICDWAYGRIMAVHLTPKGASYVGKPETFLRGKPLNVTDLVFGPDGAMYFSVGGRGTRSALYRVRYAGPGLNEVAVEEGAGQKYSRKEREDRRRMELFHNAETVSANEFEAAWQVSTSANPFVDTYVKHAAGVVVQHQPASALREKLEQVKTGSLDFSAIVSLCQRQSVYEDDDLKRLVGAVNRIPTTNEQSLLVLRAIQLALCRSKYPNSTLRDELVTAIERYYPKQSWDQRQLAVELLTYLDSAQVARKTFVEWRLERAENDQQRLFLLYALRQAKSGWTLDLRRQYIAWLKKAESFDGAQYMPRFVTFIRSDFLAGLTDAEREALKDDIAQLGKAADLPPAATTAPRPVVQQWRLQELAEAVGKLKREPDLERGKAMFHAAQCSRCHRVGKEGQAFGPDLTHVSGRFGKLELLEAIVEPSKVVDEKYRTWQIQTHEGESLTGQLVGGDKSALFFARDPLRTAEFLKIERTSIAVRKPGPTSPMPTNLLDTLTPDEVHDLLRFLGAR